MRYSIPSPRHPGLQMNTQITILTVPAKPVKKRILGHPGHQLNAAAVEMQPRHVHAMYRMIPALSPPAGSHLYIDKS